MKINLQTPGFKVTDELKEFVEINVGKLEAIWEQAIEAQVVLKLDKSDKRENKVGEIKLVIPGNDLFASRQCKSFEEAVQQCVDALRHQIDRLKTNQKRSRNAETLA